MDQVCDVGCLSLSWGSMPCRARCAALLEPYAALLAMSLIKAYQRVEERILGGIFVSPFLHPFFWRPFVIASERRAAWRLMPHWR